MDYLYVFIPDNVIRACNFTEAHKTAKYFDQFRDKMIIIDDYSRFGKWICIEKR